MSKLALASIGLLLALPLLAKPASSKSSFETRCGWVDNPTPANWSLTDKDGEWTIGVQGDYQAKGDMPDLSASWVSTNGHYGHGCACLKVKVDRKSRRVLEVADGNSLPSEKCENDRKLPKLYPTRAEVKKEIEKLTKSPVQRRYDGKFYSFSYTSDWDLDAHSADGSVTLDPVKLRDQTKEETDRISIGFLDLSKTDEGTRSIKNGILASPKQVMNGQSWIVSNEGASAEYIRSVSDTKFLTISGGSEYKAVIEKIAQSLTLK